MEDTKKTNTLMDPILSINAEIVLKERYLKKNTAGEVIETPKDLFMRVAKTVADAEKLYSKDSKISEEIFYQFYNLIASGSFLPNSPTLMNAGRANGMLSACFVLPVGDSIDEIFSSVKNTAMIQKAGGGTGFSFSKLRPKGDCVNSSGTTTSGPLPFIKVFSEATNAIQQGAFRRGANMGMMRVDHPDIIEFIKIKENLKELTNFNLSVAVTDNFMSALLADRNTDHLFINPRTKESFPLKNGTDSNWTVGQIYEQIIQYAWQNGEPGIIFIDRMNASNPVPHVGEIEATNPCGEQPLLPYESCNLGSINLKKFIQITKDGNYFDFEKFTEAIRLSTRFLDNVIDINKYPIPEITAITTANRKIGLGVMGFADALFSLGIPYNCDDGLEFGKKVMRFLSEESHKASMELAKTRGCFKNWEGSTWSKKGIKIRNACTTTVAPTGTISIIANCSGGIEPIFSLAFERNILNGKKLREINDIFKDKLEKENLMNDEMIKKIITSGSLKNIDELPADTKRVFVTARDVSPEMHVKMQAAFQEYCDSSISKTINLPYEATKEDVENTFLLAYKNGCKGITVYRDGCRMNQPMSLQKEKTKEIVNKPDVIKMVRPIALPDIMHAVRIRQITPFGNMHIKIVYDPTAKVEREVFAQLGKGGEIASSDLEAICRMISMYLRVNGSLDDVIKQLDGIGTSLSIPTKDGRIMSLADGLAKGLKKYIQAKADIVNNVTLSTTSLNKAQESMAQDKQNNSFSIKCPDCQAPLSFEEGCTKCHACGYSHC